LYQLNGKAKHILICAISEEEIAKVCSMLRAKEIWEIVGLSHE